MPATETLAVLEVMNFNPLSIQDDADLNYATSFLIDRNVTDVPVTNAKGRAVGVLSMTDLLRHAQQQQAVNCVEFNFNSIGELEFKQVDLTARVRDVMSRTIDAINVMAPLSDVLEIMLQKKVNRLFVTDTGGTPVGVISSFDVLKRISKR